MADPDVDQRFAEDDQGFLSIDFPFLNFHFNPEDTIEEYVNRIMFVVAEDVELCLGVHKLQDRLHPKAHVNANLQALQHTTTIR